MATSTAPSVSPPLRITPAMSVIRAQGSFLHEPRRKTIREGIRFEVFWFSALREDANGRESWSTLRFMLASNVHIEKLIVSMHLLGVL